MTLGGNPQRHLASPASPAPRFDHSTATGQCRHTRGGFPGLEAIAAMRIDVPALKYHLARTGMTLIDLGKRIGRTNKALSNALHRGTVDEADAMLIATA